MNRQRLFLPLLVLMVVLSFFSSIPVTYATSSTLRPNAIGTYSQFVEVPNAGFIFGDQFESNTLVPEWTDTDTGSGGTITSSSDVAHHGTYVCKAVLTNTDESYAILYKTLGSSYTELYYRLYVRVTALPSGADGNYIRLMSLKNSASGTIGLIILQMDTATVKWAMWYRNSASWSQAFSITPTPAINTWFCLELYVKVSATVGITTMWIDGTQKGTATGLVNNDRGNINQAWIDGGTSTSNLATTEYVDCAVVSTSAIGIESRSSLVNDSSDNTALQVTTSTTQKETENLADSADLGTINSVTAYIRAKYATGGGNEHLKIIWRLGSTEVQSAESAHVASTFTDYSDVRNTDPDGGTWSWTDVNSLEIGVIASTLDASEVLMFSEFYIIIDYASSQAYTVAISITLTGAWNVAITSAFKIPTSISLSTSFATSTLSAFKIALSKTFSYVSSVGVATAFRSALSQSLSSSFSVSLTEVVEFIIDLTLGIASSFNAIIHLYFIPVDFRGIVYLSFILAVCALTLGIVSLGDRKK